MVVSMSRIQGLSSAGSTPLISAGRIQAALSGCSMHMSARRTASGPTRGTCPAPWRQLHRLECCSGARSVCCQPKFPTGSRPARRVCLTRCCWCSSGAGINPVVKYTGNTQKLSKKYKLSMRPSLGALIPPHVDTCPSSSPQPSLRQPAPTASFVWFFVHPSGECLISPQCRSSIGL
jgi:hypothetical protein